MTQIGLLRNYFHRHPYRNIPHQEVVDWATDEWLSLKGTRFRDPDRGIRQLHQNGELVKVSKGVYRYDPSLAHSIDLDTFTQQQKDTILSRDKFRCVQCGRGKNEGVELHVDHIKPRKFGGVSTISNGQTLCSEHNVLKQTLSQTETGKKMFIRLLDVARQEGSRKLVDFCEDVLATYEKHGINGHIIWDHTQKD
ncbi:MAG: HNH endonuclease [Gammaproteobacteria bacterium]|nr:HNH endonuclease [Gammaproteobacteria bacterium]MYF37546.1 HNH endonuclease [Gammaproteobacteria bacterium]